MRILFLDESGDHNLSIINPDYPLFVLGGVIVEQTYAEGELTRRVQDFKRRLFGRDDIILHTADIARSKKDFGRLRIPEFRARFLEELNVLMRDLDYKVVACAIRKDDHLAQYGTAALDPYMLSLHVLAERFWFELDEFNDRGVIVAEKRNPMLDRELDIAWLNLKVKGTTFLSGTQLDARIDGLTTRAKTDNLAGLQLADLIVSPIGRRILKKKSHEDIEIIKSKFRRVRGEAKGAGLVILPHKKK
jgi:hypothetical protein